MQKAFSDLTNEGLVEEIWNLSQEEARLRDARQRAEFELVKRLEAEHAYEAYHPDISCQLVQPSPKYDPNILKQLAEVVHPDVLKTAVTPEHTEVVPEKWDARVFKTWIRRYGDKAAEIIQRATIPGGPPRLKLERKDDSARHS